MRVQRATGGLAGGEPDLEHGDAEVDQLEQRVEFLLQRDGEILDEFLQLELSKHEFGVQDRLHRVLQLKHWLRESPSKPGQKPWRMRS